MLRHYLVVAIRNLGRQRLHSALTILVLALGLTCFLAASLAVLYLDSYDTQFAKSARTYVIYQSSSWPATGYKMLLGRRSAPGLAEKLALEVPELEAVARQFVFNAVVSIDGRNGKSRPVAATDPAWLDIFDFHAVAGDTHDALERQATAILTVDVATELFGTTDAVGRTLTLSGQGSSVEVTIVAIVAPIEGPSHLSPGALSGGTQIIASWDVLSKVWPQINLTSSLFTQGNTTYAVLPAGGSLTREGLNARLRALAMQPLPETGSAITLEARPVSSVAADDLQKRFEGFQNGVLLPAAIADIVMSLGLLVLGIGCVNFVNLMTARSMGRAREIGVRKSIGATRYRIVCQELFQTSLVVLTGIVLALLAMVALERPTENQWGAFVGVPWSRPDLWALLGGLLAGVTAIAGAYPAVVLARIHPVSALRLGTMKSGPRFLRTTLVVVQVGAAAFLTIVVLVAAAQAETLRSALLGRFGDPVVLLIWPQGNPPVSFDALAAELARGPGIKGVAATVIYPLQGNSGGRARLGRSPIDEAAPANYETKFVGFDYFAVMQIPLLAGRDYSRDYADDLNPTTRDEFAARKTPFHIVLDRAALRSLGWSNPADAVGQLLYTGGPRLQSEIVGVVETVSDSVRERGSAGTIYYLYTRDAPLTVIRTAAADTRATLAYIDEVTKKFAPDAPVTRVFMDAIFDNTFRIFTLAGRLVAGVGAFAVAIAAIGLFGMAAYVTRRRTREIGLRKSQGASAAQILRMLLWDFTKPVLLGNAIACPLALMAARTYVDIFSARMPITLAPFLLALLGSLVVAWIAVGGFVWRAARVNPTVALREE